LDGLLAATASSQGWTLVTRNIKDVAYCGIAVLNPFDSQLFRAPVAGTVVREFGVQVSDTATGDPARAGTARRKGARPT